MLEASSSPDSLVPQILEVLIRHGRRFSALATIVAVIPFGAAPALAQSLQTGGIALQGGHGDPHGRAKRRDARDVLSAGAAAQFPLAQVGLSSGVANESCSIHRAKYIGSDILLDIS